MIAQPDAAAVRGVIEAINAAWSAADADGIEARLRPLFGASMTIVGPGMRTMASGREAAIESYADFVRVADIDLFEAQPATVQIEDGTAIATYRWRLCYGIEGTDYDETGHDVFVLRRDGERWIAVWRAMLPDNG